MSLKLVRTSSTETNLIETVYLYTDNDYTDVKFQKLKTTPTVEE